MLGQQLYARNAGLLKDRARTAPAGKALPLGRPAAPRLRGLGAPAARRPGDCYTRLTPVPLSLGIRHGRPDRHRPRRRRRPRPAARDGQPSRPHHRRDRHRQDRHAAGAGRALLAHRRAGVHGRREGRPVRASRRPGAPTPKLDASGSTTLGCRRAGVARLPGRRSGTSSASRVIRCARRSPTWARCCSRGCSNLNDTQEGVLTLVVQGRRRQRPAAARPEGPARDAAVRRRQRAGVQDAVRQRLAGSRSARSSAACSQLEEQGGEQFFGEPMLEHRRPDADRRDGPRRRQHPGRRQADAARRSSTRRSCCGCSSELFENLPEVGDRDKPKLVFFFDEAHLLFDDAPTALLEKIEQVVRLIRSQGRRRLLRHAEPARHARHGARPARQPRAARAARVHAARPEGGEGRSPRRCARTRSSTPSKAITRARRRRSAGLAARREGHAGHHRARLDASAGARRSARSRRTSGGKLIAGLAGRRRLREDGRPRIRVREAEGARRRERGAGTPVPPGRPDDAPRQPAAACWADSRDILFGSTGPRGGRREGMVEAAAKSAARTVGARIAREITRGVLGSLLGGRAAMNASVSPSAHAMAIGARAARRLRCPRAAADHATGGREVRAGGTRGRSSPRSPPPRPPPLRPSCRPRHRRSWKPPRFPRARSTSARAARVRSASHRHPVRSEGRRALSQAPGNGTVPVRAEPLSRQRRARLRAGRYRDHARDRGGVRQEGHARPLQVELTLHRGADSASVRSRAAYRKP